MPASSSPWQYPVRHPSRPELQSLLLSVSMLILLVCSTYLPAEDDLSGEMQVDSLASLITSSRTLVAQAAAGNTNASDFRIKATLFRESLRSFMIEREKNDHTSATLSQNDLINLVRMSALLQSAADCKTGRYIVCPPELMQQLRSQQTRLEKLLDRAG